MSNDKSNTPASKPAPEPLSGVRASIRRLDGIRPRGFVVYLVALVAIYSRPLLEFASDAIHGSLYSYVFLVPAVSIYFAALRAPGLPTSFRTAWRPALFFFAIGVLINLFYNSLSAGGWKPERVDYLSRSIASLLAFAAAGAFLFLGTALVRSIAFPWAFLIFIVPFPTVVENGLEVFFQEMSADAAYAMMKLVGLPVFREGLVFVLPNITIQVAQECSGIRSSLVLVMISVIAGQMSLRSPWKRAILTLAVIPLGIFRNGFRILTISWLCVHIDPGMIESPIHHHGGPLFFVLSLVPFFVLLFYLCKQEKAKPSEEKE